MGADQTVYAVIAAASDDLKILLLRELILLPWELTRLSLPAMTLLARYARVPTVVDPQSLHPVPKL